MEIQFKPSPRWCAYYLKRCARSYALLSSLQADLLHCAGQLEVLSRPVLGDPAVGAEVTIITRSERALLAQAFAAAIPINPTPEPHQSVLPTDWHPIEPTARYSDAPPYGLSDRQYCYTMLKMCSSYACLLGDTADLRYIICLLSSLTAPDPKGLRWPSQLPTSEPAIRESRDAMETIQRAKQAAESKPIAVARRAIIEPEIPLEIKVERKGFFF